MILVNKETSYSSVATFYTLSLDKVQRQGSTIKFDLTIDITIGPSTTAGTSYPRTAYIYTSAGTLLGSKAIKPASASWQAGNEYSYAMTLSVAAGSAAAYSQVCYLRILHPSNQSQTSPAVWNGRKETSGGSAGATFTLSADAASVIQFNGASVNRVTLNGSVCDHIKINDVTIM